MSQRQLTQVTKMAAGTLYYGFKTIGVVDPLEADLTWQTGTTPVPAGTEPYMMNESFYGQRDSKPGRWAVCPTCQEEFHQSEMITVRGKLYCVKNGCYKDVV